jgi:hypothetical protein
MIREVINSGHCHQPLESMVQSPPIYELVDYQLTSNAPSYKLGTKNCSTKTENTFPSIDPFSVTNPTTFFSLIALITVIFAPR